MHEPIKQEYAAIQKFIIECFDYIQPYFENVPENFVCPSVFFPALEMNSIKETVDSFSLSIFTDILFFEGNNNEAFEKSSLAVFRINEKHCKIPVYDANGNPTGNIVRLDTPDVSKVEEGVYKLHVAWVSKIGFDELTNKQKADNINFDYKFT